MSKSLLIFAAVATLLTGCQTIDPEAPPGKPTVTAAPRTPSAREPIWDARRITRDADRHRDAARTELGTATDRLTQYRDNDYRQLQSLVTRMRDNASATAEELEELYERVFAAEGRIKALLDRLKVITDELAAERELRQQADDKLVEAQGKIAAKEQEADQLRQQFDDMKVTADAFEANAQKNHEAALAAKGEVDKERGKKELIIQVLVVVSIALLISLAFNYVQFRSRSILPI